MFARVVRRYVASTVLVVSTPFASDSGQLRRDEECSMAKRSHVHDCGGTEGTSARRPDALANTCSVTSRSPSCGFGRVCTAD